MDPADFDDLFCTNDQAEITRLSQKIFHSVDTDKNNKLDRNEMHEMVYTYVTYMNTKGWMKSKITAAE